MARSTRVLRTLALAVIIGFVAVEARHFVSENGNSWKYSREVSNALEGARSVRIVKFDEESWANPNQSEVVHRQIEASPAQISDFRKAIGAWISPMPNPTVLRMFTPHHRVEIVRADGSAFRFEVCFHSGGFGFGPVDGSKTYGQLPLTWRTQLEEFFTNAGMPPGKD